MECACIDAPVDDCCYVLFDKMNAARKEYKCHECHRRIFKREQYRLERTVFEGRFSTHRTCIDCCSVREHLVCDFFYGYVWELIQEIIDEDPEDLPWARIGRLTPAARAHICEMIEEAWKKRYA